LLKTHQLPISAFTVAFHWMGVKLLFWSKASYKIMDNCSACSMKFHKPYAVRIVSYPSGRGPAYSGPIR